MTNDGVDSVPEYDHRDHPAHPLIVLVLIFYRRSPDLQLEDRCRGSFLERSCPSPDPRTKAGRLVAPGPSSAPSPSLTRETRPPFPCSHNGARSQMAEGFLRSPALDLGFFPVQSAGTKARRSIL